MSPLSKPPVSPRPPASPSGKRLSSPGLEFVQRVIVRNDGAETATPDSPEKELYTPTAAAESSEAPKDATKAGSRKKRWLLLLLALVAIIAIGVGVGLGVGLTRNKSKSSSNGKPIYSTTGAFNGSGIALASESFASSGYGSIVMYFQHHTGQLRQAQLSSDGTWRGGDVTEIVAADAKNGTPIAAVAYAKDDIAAVSKDINLSKEKSQTDNAKVACLLHQQRQHHHRGYKQQYHKRLGSWTNQRSPPSSTG